MATGGVTGGTAQMMQRLARKRRRGAGSRRGRGRRRGGHALSGSWWWKKAHPVDKPYFKHMAGYNYKGRGLASDWIKSQAKHYIGDRYVPTPLKRVWQAGLDLI